MKLLKCTFKLPFLLSTVILDFVKDIVIPGQNLMVWLFIVFILDFVTGIIKAYIKKDEITSKKMRDSIGKMLQYAGMIVLVIIMANATFKEEIAKAGFIIDGIFMLAILIETRSIAENFKEMAPDSTVTKLILNPLLLVFERQTKSLNNNISNPETPAQSEAQVIPPVAKMLIVLLVIGTLASCSAVKTKERVKLETASTSQVATKDSGAYSIRSAVSTLQNDSIAAKLYGYKAGNSLNILFAGNPDTVSTPVIVEQLAHKTIIHAGSRQIAAVTITNDTAATTKDSVALKTSTAAASEHKDSTFIKISDEAKSSWTDQHTTFIKSTKSLTYILFCVLGVAIILLLGGIFWMQLKNDELKSRF